jgi:hypothetical protein
MALDVSPGEVVVLDRATIKSHYLRDYKLRNPAVDTGTNTQPDIDASVFADQMMLIYADAQAIGRATSLATTRGTRLDDVGNSEGVPRRPTTGAVGFVSVVASTGGGTIFAGDVLVHPTTGLRYQCLATALYLNGGQVPVAGIDTGPTTNMPPGTVLQWSSPRPGIGPPATVVAQADGTGLKGGAPVEDDDSYAARIAQKRANPPASGNTAEVLSVVLNTTTVPVEAVWVWPAMKGPGTVAVAFTVRSDAPGGSRLPNGAQISLVLGTLQAAFPGDDGIFVANMSAQNVVLVLKQAWAAGAVPWADAAPWPPYIASNKVNVNATPTPTATTFRLTTTSAATAAPQAGQTIGFYDAANQVFRKKRILTVTVVVAGQTWDIVCDTSNNASDTSYTPASGQPASPWSDSLNLLVAPVEAYFATLGPGEMMAAPFPDPGTRQQRQPPSPGAWPSVLTNRLLTPVLATAGVADSSIVEPSVPFATTVGTPGALVYLLELTDFAVFPE